VNLDHAIAQAITRWLPTAAAQDRVRAERMVFVMAKMALEQVFSEYLGFPCQSLFHQAIITQCWHNMPIGGRSAEWSQLDSTPRPTIRVKKKIILS
jgi:hypothetical protein